MRRPNFLVKTCGKFCILVLIEGCEHDEWHVWIDLLLPVVEVDDDPVDGIHEVVESLLYRLLEGEELSLWVCQRREVSWLILRFMQPPYSKRTLFP